MEEYKLQGALRQIMNLSHLGNRYLNEQEPWKTIKTDRQATATTLHITLQIVKKLEILLHPFIPFTAAKLWKLLNLSDFPPELIWAHIREAIPAGHQILQATPLFTKIEATAPELDEKLEKIRSENAKTQ